MISIRHLGFKTGSQLTTKDPLIAPGEDALTCKDSVP